MAARRGLFGTNRLKRLRKHGANGHEEVARVAYELYEQRGRVEGHDLDDWLKAEAIVRQQEAQRTPFIV